jgi:aminoglycoside phosphotransferase (APT) family kinase protein
VLCEDSAVVGTPFYVMDCVEGRVLWDPALPGVPNSERRAMYDALNSVIARLHQVDYRAVGLEDYGRPGNYVARQVDRWTKQYRASETRHIEAMDRLIEWLPQNVPPGDETAVVHGDYRLDNVIFHPTEPQIVAVLDWELSTLGHPLADFAYHAMSWHVPGGLFRGISDLPLAQLGIPSEDEYLALYCQRTGRPAIARAHWEYYIAYNLFRLAAILQGIAKRVIDGTASSSEAESAGRRAGPLAELGWEKVQRIIGRS